MGDPVPPPRALVAVLGGGQLGRMLGLAGIPLGLRFRFLDPSAGAPAAAVGHLVVGRFDDPAALEELAAAANIVTYEWEGVPAATAHHLATRVPVYPSARSLAVSQDRLAEKELCRSLSIPTAPFVAVEHDRVADELARVGAPAILKTRSGGYDGKGQVRISSVAGAADAGTALAGQGPLLLEAEVDFVRELSVLACRGHDGEVVVYPVVVNEHAGGILRRSRPGVVADDVEAAASAIAGRLVEALDHVGVMCVELFETRAGELLVNELAPRVHNSGHWTIEGAATSQFEQHLRAILGLPLGDTRLVAPCAMVNCVATLPDRAAILRVPGARLHDYEKAPRAGRKVGHVTIVAPDHDTLDARLARVDAAMRARPPLAVS
jgi:5-(carboxyamino)imidazole ribonucleotide synthase